MNRSAVFIAAATMVISSQAMAIKPSKHSKIAKHSEGKQHMQANATPNQTNKNLLLAKIGNEPIYQSDFDFFLNNALSEEQRLHVQSTKGGMEPYLNQFLDLKVIAAKAKKEGLDKKQDYINKASMAHMQLLTQALMEQEMPNIEARAAVTNDEAKAYFNANKEKFNAKEMFSACHILIGNKSDDNKELTEAEMQAKIAKVQEELKNGKTFAEVAKNYSDDPGSKNNGGLYENIVFGRFVKEFEQAVRTQAIGQVGNPVKTQFGYHLIKVIKITPATSKTFEEVKDTVTEQATSEKFKTVITNYLNEIKKEVGYKKAEPTAVDKPNS